MRTIFSCTDMFKKYSGRTIALCRYILTLLRYIAVLTSKLNIEVLKTHLSVLKESKYTDVMQYVSYSLKD